MARTLYSQLEQIAASATYDHALDPAAVGPSQVDLEGDMNILRSQFKRVTGAADGFAAPATTIAELNSRPNAATSFHLVAVQPQDGAYGVPAGTAGNTFLTLPGIVTGTADNSETGVTAGAWAAQLTSQSNFTMHNTVAVRRLDNKQKLETATGQDVAGFLQVTAGPFPATIGNDPGTPPTWVSTGDLTSSNAGATLTRTTGNGNWLNPALTAAVARAGGIAIQATADVSSSDWMIGFMDSATTYSNYTSLDYAIENTNGNMIAQYFGVNQGSYSVVDGDILRIEMAAGGTVVIKKNGTIIHTFATAATQTNYKIVAVIYDAASPINGLATTGGTSTSLRVALRYWDGDSWEPYTLTAGDVSGGFEVVAFKINSLGGLSRYAFQPGADFVDVAQNADLGDIAAATGTYLSATPTVAAKLASLNAALVSDDTDIGNLQTADDNLQTYTGSAGDSDIDPAYSSTNTVTQGSSLTTAIGALDAGLNAHVTDASDAHDASAISTTGIAGVLGGAASNVQAVLAELKVQIDDSSPAFADTLLGANYSVNDTITVPSYTVGATAGQYARFTYNGTPLVPGASNDYVEVGTPGTTSTTIQTKRSMTNGKYLTSLILK